MLSTSYKPDFTEVKSESSRANQCLKELSTLDKTDPVADYPSLKYNIVKNASASVYAESKYTKLICTVYGPRPSSVPRFSDRGIVLCDFRYAPYAQQTRKTRQHHKDATETLFCSLLEQAIAPAIQLDKLPKHEVFIAIQIIQTSGHQFYDFCQAFNATVNALVETGIALYDTPCATIAFLPHNSSHTDADSVLPITFMPSTNPHTLRQSGEPQTGPALLFCMLPSTQQVVFTKLIGSLHHQQHWAQLSSAALKACEAVDLHMRGIAKERAKELLGMTIDPDCDDGDDNSDDGDSDQ